jgi:hypothetical protein
MDQDRERFSELLGTSSLIRTRDTADTYPPPVRVGAPLSGNFFSNKEQEALTKAANIRRLSLVLFAAEADHYVTQLPHIQERLVEILRTPTVFPKITAEVCPPRGASLRLVTEYVSRSTSAFESCCPASPRST